MLLTSLIFAMATIPQHTFGWNDTDFLLDGKRFLIRSGEMHHERIPVPYWRHRLKMAKAMGLNTVCAYLFWNHIEPEPGKWNFKGPSDVAAYCRIAHEEGLKVILRPGPYSCAEWEFGGFPYWLLKHEGIQLRTRDPQYLAAVKKYLAAVGKELAPLQWTRGGPIIMVQVENEYGSYGSDKEYIGIVAQDLRDAGFEVPLFTCDGPSQLKNDTRDDLFCAVNFGGNPEPHFKALREIRPKGPLICAEFYPGWFDSWGGKHHTGSVESVVKDLKYMLDHNASFSIYMAHGGTSFGFNSGANCPPFSPQSTSYDYDAPINENGQATPKFHALRELFAKYLLPGETLPPVPTGIAVGSLKPVRLTEFASLAANLPKPKRSPRPLTFEDVNQAYGAVLYRTSLPAGPACRLKVDEIHDYAVVSVDGKRVGVIDRRRGKNTLDLPVRKKPATLDLLIEAMGRVNYGGFIHDKKGLVGSASLVNAGENTPLKGWRMFRLPFDAEHLKTLKFGRSVGRGPGVYRGHLEISEPKDTFLDVRNWNKGMVWVNGHNLGRFWSIGPQQTMYLPGCWLKKGKNEVLVLDYGDKVAKPTVQGLTKPILDEPHPEATNLHRKPGQNLDLTGYLMAASGAFEQGDKPQSFSFAPIQARFVCLKSLGSQAGDPYASCAELYVLGGDGKPLSRAGWKISFADSEESEGEDGSADNLLDDNPKTIWHTQWVSGSPAHPHAVVIDLGKVQTLSGFTYVPRPMQSNGHPPGRIKGFEFYCKE
ncbi:MAG: beta-galactosidase [Armatimonadetes bacterium]|nr:beta-galactosidase [Armatimonadota bacterium]